MSGGVKNIPFRLTTLSLPLASNNCGIVGSVSDNLMFCGISQGSGSIPNGTFWSNYLYWNDVTSQWVVGDQTITLGHNAGQVTQGLDAIAIGTNAGQTNQGAQAIAIGFGAGESNQDKDTIILNASGGPLNSTQPNSFFVAPVRLIKPSAAISVSDPPLPMFYTVDSEIVYRVLDFMRVYNSTIFSTISNAILPFDTVAQGNDYSTYDPLTSIYTCSHSGQYLINCCLYVTCVQGPPGGDFTFASVQVNGIDLFTLGVVDSFVSNMQTMWSGGQVVTLVAGDTVNIYFTNNGYPTPITTFDFNQTTVGLIPASPNSIWSIQQLS